MRFNVFYPFNDFCIYIEKKFNSTKPSKLLHETNLSDGFIMADI